MQTLLPINLSLTESGAAALAEAAESLSTAADPGAFLTALDKNDRLWRTLMEIAHRNEWEFLDRRTSEFIMSTLRKCGHGIVDSDIEALIAINLGTSRHLAAGRDVEQIRRRAHLAWRESSRTGSTPLETWLIEHMERKSRHPGSPPLTAKAG